LSMQIPSISSLWHVMPSMTCKAFFIDGWFCCCFLVICLPFLQNSVDACTLDTDNLWWCRLSFAFSIQSRLQASWHSKYLFYINILFFWIIIPMSNGSEYAMSIIIFLSGVTYLGYELLLLVLFPIYFQFGLYSMAAHRFQFWIVVLSKSPLEKCVILAQSLFFICRLFVFL
jgi:hypothetical protein